MKFQGNYEVTKHLKSGSAESKHLKVGSTYQAIIAPSATTNEVLISVSTDGGTTNLAALKLGAGKLQFDNNNVYHAGAKPTPAELGVLSSTGGTLTGNVTINASSPRLVLDNTATVLQKSYIEFKNNISKNFTLSHEVITTPGNGVGFVLKSNDSAQHPVHIITDGEIFAKGTNKVYHEGNVHVSLVEPAPADGVDGDFWWIYE